MGFFLADLFHPLRRWWAPGLPPLEIGRVNAHHGVDAVVTAIDREPVLGRNAVRLLGSHMDLDAALGIQLETVSYHGRFRNSEN